jgi:hypothetical protein
MNARDDLASLVGKELETLAGRKNRVLRVAGEGAVLASLPGTKTALGPPRVFRTTRSG